MKRINLLIILLVLGLISFAQTDSLAPYWKNKVMPSFSLLKTDTSFFTNANLIKGKSTIFMLFNPECEHCQKQFEQLVKIPEVINTTQVVLCSTELMDKISIFYTKFHLVNYPFVHLGKDYKVFFGGFFQPKTVPVVVVYDQQNQFRFISQGQASRKQIEEALKK